MKQSDAFREGEAEAWFARNQTKIELENDPVMGVIKDAKIFDVLFDTQIGLAQYFGQWDPILYKQQNKWMRNTVGKAEFF